MDGAQLVQQAKRGHLGAVDELIKRLAAAERTIGELYFGDGFTPEKLVGIGAAHGYVVTVVAAPDA